MTQEICKNCNFWDDRTLECSAITVLFQRWTDDLLPSGTMASIAVYADDDSGLEASLKTGPLFGCKLFKEKSD